MGDLRDDFLGLSRKEWLCILMSARQGAAASVTLYCDIRNSVSRDMDLAESPPAMAGNLNDLQTDIDVSERCVEVLDGIMDRLNERIEADKKAGVN
jgi:hypothetical protein